MSFAIHLASKDGCQGAILAAGGLAGLLEDATDCAAGLYLGNHKT